MTITLKLKKELEEELSAEAKRLGLSLSDYALQLLEAGMKSEPMPRTGKDLVAYWRRHGLIGSRPEIKDSQKYARKLRKQAESRPRE